MSILLALLQFFVLISLTLHEYVKKNLSVFLWATLLVLFGIPHLLTILMGVAKYNSQTMNKASLFVVLFCISYFIIRTFLYRNIKNKGERNKHHIIKSKSTEATKRVNSRFEKYMVSILAFCVGVLLVYSIKYFGSVFNASWGRFYILNNELGSRNLMRYTQFLFFTSAGIVLVFKEKKNKIALFISVIFVLIYPIVTGNRVTILPLLVSIILIFIYNNKKRGSTKNVIALGMIGFMAIYIVYFLRLLRIYGGFASLYNSIDVLSMNKEVFDMILNGDGELSLRNAFYYFIEKDNKFPDFNKGHTYIRLLFIAIPTSLSGGLKPSDFAISMGSAWSNNFSNINYSMHPTLFGDVFANFWWFGIIWGAFWAVFAYLVDKISNHKNEVVKTLNMVVFGTMYIIIARGSVYNAVFQAFVSIVIIYLVYFISRIKI